MENFGETLNGITNIYIDYNIKKNNLNKELEQNPQIHDYWERLYLLEEETKIKVNKLIYLFNQK